MSLFHDFWERVALPTVLITTGFGFMAPMSDLSLATAESCLIDAFSVECIGTFVSATFVSALAFFLAISGIDGRTRQSIAHGLRSLLGRSLAWHAIGGIALGFSSWWFWQKLVPAACNVLTFPCATHMIASIMLALGAVTISIRWVMVISLGLTNETNPHHQTEDAAHRHHY